MTSGTKTIRIHGSIGRGVSVGLALLLVLPVNLWTSFPAQATMEMDRLWTDFYSEPPDKNLLHATYLCSVCHGGLDANQDGVIDNNAVDTSGAGGSLMNLYGLDLDQYTPILLDLNDPTDTDKNGIADTVDQFTDYLLWIELNDPDQDGCDSYTEISTNTVVPSHPGVHNPLTCSMFDTDGDGIPDVNDLCPNSMNPTLPQPDMDMDGIGDDCDADKDGDGYEGLLGTGEDCDDNKYGTNPGAKEICGNAIDENCDGLVQPFGADSNGNGVPDCNELCPGSVVPETWDLDCDGIGDSCDETPCGEDPDGDCLPTNSPCGRRDNCPLVSNSGQVDRDYDGIGDACDCDMDGDGYQTQIVKLDVFGNILCPGDGTDCMDQNGKITPDRIETCKNAYDDNCDGYTCPEGSPDPDVDGVPQDEDNCPFLYNPLQADPDNDGVGYLCEDCGTDCDGDGLENAIDPKPWIVPDGDVNRDGLVDLGDLLLAEQMASGALASPDPLRSHMADCAPFLSSPGSPADNVVDLQDVHHLMKMIQGP